MKIVDQARNAADRLLLEDECTIHTLDDPVFDENTGEYTNPTTQVYSGKCNLTPYSGAGEIDEAIGGESVVTRNYRLTLPYTAGNIPKEAVVTMTVSEDSALVGRTFRVDHSGGETFQTARRLIVEAIDTSEA